VRGPIRSGFGLRVITARRDFRVRRHVPNHLADGIVLPEIPFGESKFDASVTDLISEREVVADLLNIGWPQRR